MEEWIIKNKIPTKNLNEREPKIQIKTDLENGLTSSAAEQRLKLYGPNVIPNLKPNLYQKRI